MTITAEEFFKKLEAMERSKKIDILKKIAAFCYKKYNVNSDWNSWAFKNFLWSEWEIKCDQQICLIGNAKVILDSQTIAHVRVFCGFIPSFSLIPEIRVTGTIFDLRTGKIKEIAMCKEYGDPDNGYYSGFGISDKQEEITFIRDKTGEIAEAISNFIKTIT
jgi:hypothetical protein